MANLEDLPKLGEDIINIKIIMIRSNEEIKRKLEKSIPIRTDNMNTACIERR